MNSIISKQNLFRQRFQILTKTRFLVKKNFSKDSEEESRPKEEGGPNVGQGILHDKQQSVKEESYFHKEGMEQLKSLKNRIKKKLTDKPDKEEKNQS